MDHDLKTLLTSISLCATLFTMLAACLCCRKKVPKNEFLGLEGKVKIKNPEENACNTDASPQVDKTFTNGADIDTKRVSGAPNRSLPDIPVVETTADNVYDFYASVEEKKVQPKPQGRLSLQTAKPQSSVSQHSSISQADDISSPYARVRLEEHPYAQLNNVAPSSSINRSSAENSPSISTSRRGSNQSLLGGLQNQPEIPAASAIAGMVSASQELPYMTPPIIIQQQSHFSGDSQDSAKGYTSISVREPLANILAQTVYPSLRTVQKEICDSHYATVSDDSDEMYAAIEDPSNVADTYTSGSETYAQIQPTNAITVSVEINTTNVYNTEKQDDARTTASNNQTHEAPVLPSVDTLKAQMHSRQASSSSNTSSVGIIGSPKPEKRQANSPLPPTPKNLQHSSNCNLNSISSSHSDRNSVTSVKECAGSNVVNSGFLLKDNVGFEADASSSNTKNFSPSKDVEGMYAKVMKKNKLSNTSSQNSSPVLNRKLEENKILEAPYSDIATEVVQKSPVKNKLVKAINDDNYETLGKNRARKTSYETKDHGYETIPGEKTNSAKVSSYLSRSDGYAQIKQNDGSNEREVQLSGNKSDTIYGEISKIKNETSEQGYESLSDQSAKDAGYEILKSGNSEVKKPVSDYDPNYETLRSANYSDSEQGRDDADGYSKVKQPQHIKVDYNDIQNNGGSIFDIENHDYASIVEANGALNCQQNLNCSDNEENRYDIYSSLKAEGTNLYLEINKDSMENHGYQTINKLPTDDTISITKASASNSMSPSPSSNRYFSSTSETPNFNVQMKGSSTSNTLNSDRQQSNNCESLTGSESDPNYESVKYIDLENSYERLHSEANTSPETPECSASIPSTKKSLVSDLSHNSVNTVVHTRNGEVDDYFQV